MRTYGGLWERIVSEENLREAWRRVRRGHARTPEVVAYGAVLDANLAALRAELIAGTWRPGSFRQFKVWDPKPRVISCAPVADRVVHHALCGVVAPLLERGFIDRSFACREGKGAHLACRLAREEARHHGWFLKIDVRHYFDSIPHDRLVEVLCAKFREREVRALVESIVRHGVPGLPDGFGLPIGNLTSQWFANAYLDGLDHLLAEKMCHGSAYLRYMDDMLCFCDAKAECWALHDLAHDWLAEERGLALKDEATVIAPVSEGVPFLGLRIFPNAWRLRRSRFLRTRRTAAERMAQFEVGEIGEQTLAQCLSSADGAARWFGFKGILPNNLAPGDGASSGSNRVNRGGSWNNNANNCRSAYRNNNNPSNANNNLGFRPSIIRHTVMIQEAGSHPGQPAPRERADEHARRPPAGSRDSGDSRGGVFPAPLFEKVGMGTHTEANELQLSVVDCVDQNEVRLDVAVAASGVFSLERMVVKRGGEGLPGTEKPDGSLDFFRIPASSNGKFEVPVKSCRVNRGQHGGQPFMSSANISSTFLNGPCIGSAPSRYLSKTARVSALGQSSSPNESGSAATEGSDCSGAWSYSNFGSAEFSMDFSDGDLPRATGAANPRCARVCMRRTFMPVEVVMPSFPKSSSARFLISGFTRNAMVAVAAMEKSPCFDLSNNSIDSSAFCGEMQTESVFLRKVQP